MKKAFLIILLSLFGSATMLPAPGGTFVVFAQKKDDRKDPAGPPVVKPKGGGQDKPKDPPKKSKKDG